MANGSNGSNREPADARSLTVDALVGAKIRQSREALGMSVAELAQAIGASPAELVAIEQGEMRAEPRALAGIARAMGVSVAWFFLAAND